MTGIWCSTRQPIPKSLLPQGKRVHGFKCCSTAPDNNFNNNETKTPQWLKIAVSGATGILSVFSSSSTNNRSSSELNLWMNDISVSSVDDVLAAIKSDYEKAYFATGQFTTAIYAEDCIFEDPTIKFQGRELYARNLSFLVPFFDKPSIQLKNIQKGISTKMEFIVASWTLRTYLKLPWKPLISIDGKTVYNLDGQLRIVKHVESWDISALEAVGQIFIPSSGRSGQGT